ncbi:MAG: response regulator [Granulosicoccus sp.]
MDTEFEVLVVEDNSNDFEMLQRTLRRTRMFDLTREGSAGDGLSELSRKRYDVVLLDLTLPDSEGLESVIAFTSLASTPVVVLSGIDDENTALESVQHGAHDYLVKGKFDTTLISRTLRYAIERFRLLEELRVTQQQVRREQELRRLESDASSPVQRDAVVSVHELSTLKTTNEEFFTHAVNEYSNLINKALELRHFKIEYNVAKKLRSLADSLGANKASPRDVVEVHTTSLNAKLASMSARRSSLCNEEARYLLTGLLGHLCLFYQSRCVPDAAPSGRDVTPEQAALEPSLDSSAVSEQG